MFSSAVIWWPQEGQVERGVTRSYRSVAGGFSPLISADSARQRFSMIRGMRWITTFRKLPVHRPSTTQVVTKRTGDCCSSVTADITPADAAGGAAASDDGAEFKYRQIHRDDEAADERAQHHHDHRFHQARECRHRVIDFLLEVVGGLAEHAVE